MPSLKTEHLLLLLFVLTGIPGMSQSVKSDVQLMAAPVMPESRFQQVPATFLLPAARSPLIRYNPVSLTAGGLMYFYQQCLSKHISAGCLYNPSCSSFGRDLIREFGLLGGSLYTADRIMRCNRVAALDVKPWQVDRHDHKIHENPAVYRKKP